MNRVAGYDYNAFCAGIAERDGAECWLHKLLVARRAVQVEKWGGGGAEGDDPMCARGWVPKRLLECGVGIPLGIMDGHHLGLSKSWLKSEFPHGKGKLLGRERVDVAVLGRPDAVVISETVLTRPLADLLNDPRNGVCVCRKHHDMLEHAVIKIARADLPPTVEEFAAELGDKAVARLERQYGPRSVNVEEGV